MAEQDIPTTEDPTADSPDTDHAGGAHEAPDGAPLHPLIDLSRDPNPGSPNHARPED